MKKNQKGFTLIELIVVVGVMAILTGVAVPTYTSYIAKANQGVDTELLSDINYAVQVALRQGTAPDGTGGILVTADGTEIETSESDMETFLTQAMADAFGSNWASQTLKYDGWENSVSTDSASFASSSFNGDEEELIATISELVSTLSESGLISLLTGSGLTDYLTENGIDQNDSVAAANAAVLYLAENTAGESETIQTAIANAISTADAAVLAGSYTYGSESYLSAVLGGMLSELQSEIGLLPSCAAAYAYVEAFCRTQSNSSDRLSVLSTSVGSISSAASEREATTALLQAMGAAARDEISGAEYVFTKFCDYIKGETASADIQAYADALELVLDYQDVLDLSSETCFTDVTSLVSTLLNTNMESSEIGVFVVVSGDQQLLVTVPALD